MKLWNPASATAIYAKLDEGEGTDKRDGKVLGFVLDKGTKGFTEGKPFRKMGINSSRTGELFRSPTPKVASSEASRSVTSN